MTKQTRTIQFSLLSPGVLTTGWMVDTDASKTKQGTNQRRRRERERSRKRGVLPPAVLEGLSKVFACAVTLVFGFTSKWTAVFLYREPHPLLLWSATITAKAGHWLHSSLTELASASILYTVCTKITHTLCLYLAISMGFCT